MLVFVVVIPLSWRYILIFTVYFEIKNQPHRYGWYEYAAYCGDSFL